MGNLSAKPVVYVGIMAMTTGSSKGDINITPLIDVLLVLLIIFMVITPTKQIGLNAHIPQPSSANGNHESDRTIVVSIDSRLKMTINSEPVELDQLEKRLSDIFKIRADKTMFVRADREIDFSHVARAIDIAKGVGIGRIGLLSESSRTEHN